MSKNSLKIVPIIVALLAAPAVAQQKIGFVDTVQVMTESAEGKAKIESWNQLVTAKQQQINVEAEDLQKLQQQLAQQALSLNPETQAEMQQNIEEKQTRVKRMREDAGRETERRRNEILQEMNMKIRALLDDYGKQHGYAAIFLRDPSQQIFVADALDITQDVLLLFNQKHPATGSGQ